MVLANQSFGVFAEKTEEEVSTEQGEKTDTTESVDEKNKTDDEENNVTTEKIKEETTTTTNKTTQTKKKIVAKQSNQEIEFDLSKGSVVFKADKTYVGYDSKGKEIKGNHSDLTTYRIMQSGANSTTNTITIETKNLYSENIEQKNQNSIYNIILDNVNINCSDQPSVPDGTVCEGDVTVSHYYRTLKQQLSYYQANRIYTPFLAGDDTISVNVTLVGDNHLYAQPGAGATLQYAHYPMGESGNGQLKIEGNGSLDAQQTTDGSVNRGACIGGPMLYKSENHNGRAGNGSLIFQSGNVNVKTKEESFSSAIGGGSCSPTEKPIIFDGSNVTAKSYNTSAAIGAGGGSTGIGESADQIEIRDGEITVYSPEKGVGIGGGTSQQRSGGEAKNITISGGKVKVYGPDISSYGMIGGGTSRDIGTEIEERNGGAANITISGGTVIAGSIGGGSTDAANAKGGNATIKVSGDANIETDSIGGGESKTGSGGDASVTVNGGNLTVTGTIGGGTSTSGKGGDASINVSGGTLDCASIGGGNSTTGKPGSVTSTDQDAGVVVLGGTLKAGTIGGGTNEAKEIGFATANISGGDIQGQFILSNTDKSQKCTFTMTGGTIDNTNLGEGKYIKAQDNGGAVYLSDENGEVNISGGTIKNSKATLGGAIYMTAGTFELSGTGAIYDCKADKGGAVYLDQGKVTISGGTIGTFIDNKSHPNTAQEGGGVYMAGGDMNVTQGKIGYNSAANGAGAYLKAGSMTVSKEAAIEHNTSDENGGGMYLAGGSLTMSGGQITKNTATQNGGGAYLKAGDMTVSGGQISQNTAANGAGTYLETGNLTIKGTGSLLSNTAADNGGGAYLEKGTLNLDNGSIDNNKAKNGGGSYLAGGNLQVTGGSISTNTAENGGGSYLSGGNLQMNGGSISTNTAENGAGTYLSGGKLYISGGNTNNNIATQNGGAAYVADSTVRMFGGNISNNKATQNGGGMYVSSINKAADVVIRSGKLTGNKAGISDSTSGEGNGGAIAVISNSNSANKDHVIIGLCHKHKDLDVTTRKFDKFTYEDDKDDDKSHDHESCPEITDNESYGNGGGIYMNSNQSVIDIYCLIEGNNTAAKDKNGGSIMSEGGNVNIGDIGDDGKGNNTENAVGNVFIKSPMLVKGGNVNLYGNTENPKFADKILVDIIKQDAGSFHDWRFTQMEGDINYKIEYFENFNDSGIFTSMQYTAEQDITAMGNMYTHEGYKIIGWNTQKDGKGTMYTTGKLIASKNDHDAWNGKNSTEALRLYAIWKKISYTVEYDPAVDEYSGSMSSDIFQYEVEKPLTKNAYKVTGKRFVKWNTQKDGTGQDYEDGYDKSDITSKDGATVTLYAQWKDCTHKTEDGAKLSYKSDNTAHTITETCDCEGHTSTVKIEGADVYFDGAEHPATLHYTGDKFLAGEPHITYTYKEHSEDSYGNMPTGTAKPTYAGYYKATITVDEETTYVEYRIKSPAEAAEIDIAATPGQYFKNFNAGKSCKVAKEDAFTVQYEVQGLNAGTNAGSNKVYKTAPVLTLSQALPAGTKIIMQTEKSYWYNNNPTGTQIELASFTKMGTTSEKYSYSTTDIKDAQNYRFIIDFSDVNEEDYLSGTLDIGLKYAYTNPTTNELETGNDKEEKATITISDKYAFTAVASAGENTCTITAPSPTTNTKWERKNLVWKITPKDTANKLPSDAKLTLSTTVDNEVKTAIYSLNANGEFIIPFSWTNRQNVTFALNTQQESTEAKSYKLNASLCVGSKKDGTTQPTAIEDNKEKTSTDIALTVPVNTVPSLKISGTDRVLTSSEKLKVDIKYLNLNTNDYTIQAVIQKKSGDEYKGEYYKETIEQTGNHEFSLQSTDGAGSYRLFVTVSTTKGQTVMEVPYYFIVQ